MVSNKRSYLILFIIVATELIGFGLIIPILPQISQNYTSSGPLLGLLLASYSIAQFFAAPFLGQLSDKYGRKTILVLSKCGTVISYIVLALANSYTLILISRLLDGFTGGNIAVARAYLADITAEEHRSKAMAIIGVAFGTGFIFGPAIGGFCYAYAPGFGLAGMIGAGLSFASLIITLVGLPANKIITPTKEKTRLSAIKNLPKEHQILLGLSFIGMVVFASFETSFSVFTEAKFNLNAHQNSQLFLLIGIIAFFVQGSFTRFSIQPIHKAISIAFFSIGVALIAASSFTTMALALAPLVLLIFGIAILNTHIPAELSKETQHKGLILGIYESINSIARIVGPLLIFTTLYSNILWSYAILGGGIIAIGVLARIFTHQSKTRASL